MFEVILDEHSVRELNAVTRLAFSQSENLALKTRGERAYLLMLEKASMLIVLFFILMVVVALDLPGWLED